MTSPMRWRMFGYMAALFIAGAITGAAVMARTAAGSQTLKVGRTEEIQKLIKQRLQVLELTPEQRKQIDPLIQKTSQELEDGHRDCLERCSGAVESMNAQIRLVLTPEQAEKFAQLNSERRALMLKKYNFTPATAQAGKP